MAQRSAKTGTAGTVFTWLFSNHDGTVDTQTVARTGATTRSYRDPFGVPIGGSTGVWANGNGFLNKPVVGSTKLTTIGARTYAAVIGRFISVDPIADPDNPQQYLGYAYSGNNPMTFSDPTGLRLDEGCGWQRRCGDVSTGRVVSIWDFFPDYEPLPSLIDQSREASAHPVQTEVVDQDNDGRPDAPWGSIVDLPDGAVSFEVSGSVCAFACLRGSIGTSGFSYGFGLGADVGFGLVSGRV